MNFAADRRQLLCISILLALSGAPLRAAKPQEMPAGVAAVVNGQPIPEKLVDAFLTNGREELKIDPATEEGKTKLVQLRKHIIDEQIDRLLIAQETERRKIAPAKEQIDKAEQNRIVLLGSEERYEKFLEQNHFSRDDFRRYVLRSELCGAAMTEALRKEIAIADEEIRRHYEAHRQEAEFQRPERVTAAHILLNGRRTLLASEWQLARGLAPGPELEKAVDAEIARRRALAEEIRGKAAAPGADFVALAREFSHDFGTRNQGGSLGTFAKGTHPLALDEVAFQLKSGEIGPVVETEFGFHVLKKIDHRPGGTKTLEEATPQIELYLSRAALARRMREWLAEARGKADVAIRAAASAPSS